MKTIISYSKRRADGNCNLISDYISKQLFKEHDHKVFKLNQVVVKGCGDCDYDCFKRSACPIKDDVAKIYKMIIDSSLVVHILPVYSNAPPSQYFQLRERIQSHMMTEGFEEAYNKVKKAYIIIGQVNHGGLETSRIIKEGNDLVSPDEVLLIDSKGYGCRSINGDLVRQEGVMKAVHKFVNSIM